MKICLASLGTGLLVGIIYGVLEVRSPAPPVVALIGLLGILAGEQVPPLVRHAIGGNPAAHAWLHSIQPHMFGQMPGQPRDSKGQASGGVSTKSGFEKDRPS